MTNVIQFPHAAAPVQPIAHFIRLGESGYNKLAGLHAAGRLPASRVVVDASRLKHQKELIAALKAQGAEIVLDTKAAELSSVEKFSGHAHHAPWAAIGEGRPLAPQHFVPRSAADIFGLIARFAVEHQVDAVLAPTHFVGDPLFGNWTAIDHDGCLAMRRALDREGGAAIALDYLLIAPHTVLNDDGLRRETMIALDSLPYDNLWVRASGFGNDAAPLTTKRFIVSLAALHNLGRPMIADYLGGLVGQAALAFGAVSGIAHGIGERERFDARSWHKPAKKIEPGKGGRAVRVFIPGLDRTATVPELELMANARGGRRLVACCNRACCSNGLKDMIADPRQHAAYQSFAMVAELAGIPDLNREQHFLNGRMKAIDQHARLVKSLKFSTEEAVKRGVDVGKLSKRLGDHSKQVEKMRRSLEDLHESRAGSVPRARPVTRMASRNNSKAEAK